MAFNQANFAPVGAVSTDTPAIYSYITSDLSAVVLAVGYFKPKELQLSEKDWIFAVVGDDVLLIQITADTSTAALSNLIIEPSHAEYHLPSPEAVVINNDGVTYVPIPNMELALGSGFSSAGGKLTYELTSGRFLMNGSSDLEVNKALDLTYALVINGVVVPTELTTVSFTSSGKKRNISITSIAQINKDDEIEIWTKGDGTTGVTATINKLDTTFLRIS